MKFIFQTITTCSLFLLLAFGVFSQTKPTNEPNMMKNIPEGEATFTEADLKDYYIVYENKVVKHIRTVIDRYLNLPQKADNESLQLKSVDTSFLKSKFIVLSNDPDYFGTTQITLIFVDKPEKVFKAGVYTGNGLRLDRLLIDERFNDEDVRRVKIRYRRFLEDKQHSM